DSLEVELIDGADGARVDADKIRRLVSAHRTELASCAVAGLTRAPSGKVSFIAHVKPNGAVRSVELDSSSAADNAFARCVSTRMRVWSFAHFSGDHRARVRISFIVVPAE